MSEKESPARSGAETVIATLSQRWPRAFAVRQSQRRPLEIGIHVDMLAALDGAMTAAELGDALDGYVKSSGYLRRLTRAGAERTRPRWRAGRRGYAGGSESSPDDAVAVGLASGRASRGRSSRL